ncbi:MAG: class I SAM-dependent methyltransferase [Nitrospira sp.]|nr:class I SAM-dependent methyltransferase [Nitrospira sp.]
MTDLVLPKIDAYAAAHSIPETPTRRALREETERTMEFARMLVGPLEGAFLHLMARLVQATRVLEIGMFTGYSALCFAEAMPDQGRVITCEVDEESASVARRFFAQSTHGRKIEIRMGPALETMAGLTGPFDLIFIDADKLNYVNYYHRAMELLSPRGVMLIDNVLWNGDVLHDPPPDDRTAAIQALNRIVTADARVSAVLATIRDGIWIITPRSSA